MISALLTGYCRLKGHMYNIGPAEDVIGRFCKKEEERPVHLVCHSESLARTRFLVLGEEKPTAHTYLN